MTKLEWNRLGERFFQTGVDRGVLFVEGAPVGVPWNGLAAVKEGSTGGEAVATYIDGIKVNQETTLEEFKGTIEAYMYPDEFEECQGEFHPQDSLLGIAQQPRKSFAVAYRTRLGNDVMSTDYGYKIHIVVGLTATPSTRKHATMDANTDIDPLSWDVVSIPSAVPGYLATSHLVFDSTKMYAAKLEQLEAILFGTEDENSRMPTAAEMVEILTWYNPVWIWSNERTTVADNMVITPNPPAYGSGWATHTGLLAKDGEWIIVDSNSTTTPYIFTSPIDEAIGVGHLLTLSIDLCVEAVAGAATHIAVIPHSKSGNQYLVNPPLRTVIPIVLGLEQRVVIQWISTAAVTDNFFDIALVGSNAAGAFATASRIKWRVRRPKIERGLTDGVFYVPGNQRSVYSNLPGYHYHEILGIHDPRLPGDLNEVRPGLFERMPTTRLVESVTEGLYRMEA